MKCEHKKNYIYPQYATDEETILYFYCGDCDKRI